MSKKKKVNYKAVFTVHIDSKLLEEWRSEVIKQGKFFTKALDESMKLYLLNN